MTKKGINYNSMIELIEEREIEKELGEAYSSILLNPAVAWAKLEVTDDAPNINKQRVPKSEFDNIIRSGTYMPIKMAKGEIKDGHDGAEPLGVFTTLLQVGNKIIGLAALWKKERPSDIAYIKELLSQGIPVNISWEILYEDERVSTDGVVDLVGCTLKAATIVGLPAYAGRTQVLAVSSESTSKVEEDNVVEEKLKQKKQLEEKAAEEVLETPADDAAEEGAVVEESAEESVENDSTEQPKEDLGSDAEKEKSLETELEELRSFKENIQKKEAAIARMRELKSKFAEAGLEKSDSFFENNFELLTGMTEEQLNFFVQELVGFASASMRVSEEEKPAIPNFSVKSRKEATLDDIIAALKARNKPLED